MITKLHSTYRQQVYWALGKLVDANQVTFFKKRLAHELQRDLIAVYQILIALDDLKEPVFAEDRVGNAAMHEYELNRADAEAYLNCQP